MADRKIHKRTWLGIIITVVYCSIFVYSFQKGYFSWSNNLNEVGDAIAGLFAPLAFFWLVLGYFLQAEELRNSIAELKGSKEQQERTANIAEQQVAIEEIKMIEASLLTCARRIFETGYGVEDSKRKEMNSPFMQATEKTAALDPNIYYLQASHVLQSNQKLSRIEGVVKNMSFYVTHYEKYQKVVFNLPFEPFANTPKEALYNTCSELLKP